MPDATPVSAAQVSTRLARVRQHFDTGDLAGLFTDLPQLLAAGHQHIERGGDPAIYARLAGCYDLATSALNKISRYHVSRITADRATAYARLSGSPIAMAAADRSLSIVLRHEGRIATADRLMINAITQLEATGLRTDTQRSAFTQMLCTTAYTAASAGVRDRALELITEARRAAAGLPTHPIVGQPFTVTLAQVALYKVGVHWSLGDAGAAIATARGLDASQFSTPERRGRLYTDLARAWWQWGKPEPTVSALLTAHSHAPSEVVNRPSIRTIAIHLIEKHARMAGVPQLAAAIGYRRSG